MTAPTQTEGRRAWTAVGVAFAAMFVSFGVAYSFGAFLLPISTELRTGLGATSVVFSLTTMMLFALGALTGPAVDRFGPRPVVLTGAVAFGVGLLLTSRATALWQAYLGHGLGLGLAIACTYVPLVTNVSGWFDRRRTLAVGVAVCGIGLGTLVLSPVAAALIGEMGWRRSYLVLAVVGTAVLLACAVLVRPAPVAAVADRVPLWPRVRSAAYLRLYLAGMLLSVGLFVPFVHLPAYAVSRGVGVVPAAGLVGIIGASSIIGRAGLGAAATRFGVLRTYQGCFAAMAVSFLLLLSGPGYPRLVVFALVLGIGYGGFVALGPPLLAELYGLPGLGALIGVLYTGAAFGSAFGPPLAGVIISSRGGYPAAFVVALVVGALAAAVAMSVRPVAVRGPSPDGAGH